VFLGARCNPTLFFNTFIFFANKKIQKIEIIINLKKKSFYFCEKRQFKKSKKKILPDASPSKQRQAPVLRNHQPIWISSDGCWSHFQQEGQQKNQCSQNCKTYWM
jgi:glucan-binding YG repeat protein